MEITINPKIYPLEAVYAASYVFLDRAFIRLDGDPKKEIKVTLEPKKDKPGLDKEFLNELINYSDYSIRAKQTRGLREALMQKALLTNDPGAIDDPFDALDDDYIDDPEGIAIPWEEKYGKDKPK